MSWACLFLSYTNSLYNRCTFSDSVTEPQRNPGFGIILNRIRGTGFLKIVFIFYWYCLAVAKSTSLYASPQKTMYSHMPCYVGFAYLRCFYLFHLQSSDSLQIPNTSINLQPHEFLSINHPHKTFLVNKKI